MPGGPLTRQAALAMDAADELAFLRDEFALPAGVVYLDGNSLGALPRATAARLAEVIEREWGERLVRSWNESGWIELLAGALRLRPGRRVIVSEAENFPTDLYVAQGLASLAPDLELRLVPRAELAAALDERAAV